MRLMAESVRHWLSTSVVVRDDACFTAPCSPFVGDMVDISTVEVGPFTVPVE